jgi:hypothetical protein
LRHSAFLLDDPEDEEKLVDCFRALRRSGVGPFRDLPDDPPLTEIPFPVAPAETQELNWDGQGTAECLGNDPLLIFSLPQRRFVFAIRVKCSYGEAGSRAHLQAAWKDGRNDFSDEERSFRLNVRGEEGDSPDEKTVTIPVYDTIGQFRIRPHDAPCVFKLSEIVLLVPR